jgi:hypothetical protein
VAIGPGKYDGLCTLVRETAKAEGVLLMILGGDKGDGFSCQADLMTTAALPKMLRSIANQIEAGFKKGEL